MAKEKLLLRVIHRGTKDPGYVRQEDYEIDDPRRLLRLMEAIADELCHPSLFSLTITLQVGES